MGKVLVTGAGGLVGSESVRYFVEAGFDVVGVENDQRARFFGPEASTKPTADRLERAYASNFQLVREDIRDADRMKALLLQHRRDLELVIHTAAQPAHDWAVRDPQTDFAVNAVGTLNLLEATRLARWETPFVHCSTSKVYGDTPNALPLIERRNRLDLRRDHRYYRGIDTSMSIDQSTHSLFGASKASGDLMVQEYGRYFGMPTVCFRPGCLTGPNHAGTQLHGFLAYLMRCTVTGDPYTIFGYGGKQVRCNLHSEDLVAAFDHFYMAPGSGLVYNIGGGRKSNCSMLEAISLCEEIAGRPLDVSYCQKPRIGDHRWWISDNTAFESRYPWGVRYDTEGILRDIYEQNVGRWIAS